MLEMKGGLVHKAVNSWFSKTYVILGKALILYFHTFCFSILKTFKKRFKKE